MKKFILLSASLFLFSCEKTPIEKMSPEHELTLRSMAEDNLKKAVDTLCYEFLFVLDDNFDAIYTYPGSASFSLQSFVGELEAEGIIRQARLTQICSNIKTCAIAVGDDKIAEEIITSQIMLRMSPVVAAKNSLELTLLAGENLEIRTYPCTDEFVGTMNAQAVVFGVCLVLAAESGPGCLGCAVMFAAAYYDASNSFCACLKSSYGHGC